MYINFEIVFPEPGWATDPSKLALLEQILPARATLPSLTGVTVDEVVLSAVDPIKQSKGAKAGGAGGAGGAYDSDDDEQGAHGHGPGVQCAQQ